MKVVLSRKGFDSSAGGVPSPILPDGRLIPLPIPDPQSPVRYRDLRDTELELGSLVHSLSRGCVRGVSRAHLDPDLALDQVARPDGYLPCLGQSGAAARHLEHQGVGVGDLFLFFGWFRQVEEVATRMGRARYRYVRNAPDLHAIFGWLQIGRIYQAGEAWPREVALHPHNYGYRRAPNRLFVAADGLRLEGAAPSLGGAGRLSHLRTEQILTWPGENRSVWRLPSWCFPEGGRCPFSYHERRARWGRQDGAVRLESAARGQEFVLDAAHYPEAIRWCGSILSEGAGTKLS